MTTVKPESIWSQTFALLCLTQLLGYAHNALLTPTIPLYVTHLGGSPFVVGVVLAAFAVTSVLLRPPIGYWADRWSESGVLVAGGLLLGASLLVFFIPFTLTAMFANSLRGIGWAGLNTGGYALLALIAPATRRGEASGYYSAVQASVSILFPALALWLIEAPLGGFRVVLLLSAGFAACAAIIGTALSRSASSGAGERSARGSEAARFTGFAFVDRDVLLASVLLFCIHVTNPCVTGFLVLYARAIRIEHLAWYFVAGGSTSLLARPVLGRLADRVGWGRSLAAGFALQLLALLLLSVASGLALLIFAGILYALGAAVGSAATLALAIQRANPERRGRAMASFSIAYPLSAGIGALLAGSAVELAGYTAMYLMGTMLAGAGWLVTLANWSDLGGERQVSPT